MSNLKYVYNADGNVTISNVFKVNEVLDSGMYEPTHTEFRVPALKRVDIPPSKGLFEFNEGVLGILHGEIGRFFSDIQRSRYTELQLEHKRGYLLYGPQGTGKTSVVTLLIHGFLKQTNGVVFVIPDENALNSFLKQYTEMYRKIEPSRPTMIVMEDIDNLVDYDEIGVLDVLDGKYKFDNTVTLATTNYFKDLPERLVNRPSRFARLIEMKPPAVPSVKMRERYLTNKTGNLSGFKHNVKSLVKKTDGYSFDMLKELITLLHAHQMPITDALRRITELSHGFNSEE